MTLVISVMAFATIMIVKRLRKLSRYLLDKFNRHQLLKRTDKLFGVEKLKTESFMCVACEERPKNIIFKPCLHLAYCSTCESKLEVTKCPICRQEIEDKVAVYVV